MISIAFFNNKGGVGKTTLLCNVASQLAMKKGRSVLVVDADPQCNATQSMFSDDDIDDMYSSSKTFTVYSIIHPLSLGKGYQQTLTPVRRPVFGCDIIIGDPRLALKEDLLARDWSSAVGGDIRGLRTTFVFSELLSRCQSYDYVFFDMGPSLGSINRACMLACDYFVSPMSIDIFSLRAIENITTSIENWRKNLDTSIRNVEDSDDIPVSIKRNMDIKFAGYVTQQYTAKSTGTGEKRAVRAYEKIMRQIPEFITENFVEHLQPDAADVAYALGTVPNLHSLIPMAQFSRKPIAELKKADGVLGAHFAKVQEASDLFLGIANQLEQNLDVLGTR